MMLAAGATLAAAWLGMTAQRSAEAAAPTPPVALALRGGKVVVADRASGTISVIFTRNDRLVGTYDMPDEGEPMYVVYSPIEDRVFVGDRANDRVVAFDALTFDVVGFAEAGAGVFHMWADADLGQLWVNNDIDNTTSVIDLHSLETIMTIPTPADLVALGGKPHDVIIGPNGMFAYITIIGIAGEMDAVVQYSTATFKEVNRTAVGGDPHVAVTTLTDFLYVPCQGANAVYVLDRITMDLVEIIDVPGAHGAGINENGNFFYTTNLPGGGEDGLFTIDAVTLDVLGEPVDTPFAVPHNIVLTPNGEKLYLTHSGATSDKVTVYELVGKNRLPQLIGEVTVGLNPFGLDYVP